MATKAVMNLVNVKPPVDGLLEYLLVNLAQGLWKTTMAIKAEGKEGEGAIFTYCYPNKVYPTLAGESCGIMEESTTHYFLLQTGTCLQIVLPEISIHYTLQALT